MNECSHNGLCTPDGCVCNLVLNNNKFRDGKEKIVLYEISKMGMLEQIFRLNVKKDGQDLPVKKKHASKIVTKMEYAKMVFY